MLIKHKIGTLQTIEAGHQKIDLLPLHWYETAKRILHKRTIAGREVILKFLKEGPQLSQDDVLYADEQEIIAVDIQPCDVIAIRPQSMYEMALIAYEIGNKHLPLFY